MSFSTFLDGLWGAYGRSSWKEAGQIPGPGGTMLEPGLVGFMWANRNRFLGFYWLPT